LTIASFFHKLAVLPVEVRLPPGYPPKYTVGFKEMEERFRLNEAQLSDSARTAAESDYVSAIPSLHSISLIICIAILILAAVIIP
jgi:hypothetical protein